MHKFYTLFLSMILISFFSCKNDEFTLGEGWVDPKIRIIKIDTVTVELSTLQEDSISTKSQGVLLVGQFDDSEFTGKTMAKSYFTITKPKDIEELADQDFFDSLVIEFKTSGKYLGDTLKKQSFSVYRLAEELEHKFEETTYYNTTSFQLENTPLAVAEFFPDPVRNSADTEFSFELEPIRIRLPDALGMEIFEKIRDKDEDLESADKFSDYIKGLAFVPNDPTNSIIAIRADTSFRVRLYYHKEEVYVEEKQFDFNIHEKNYFSNINSDRANTELVGFDDDGELNSYETSDMAYLQSGQLNVKMKFPTIGDLTTIGSNGYIERAILKLKPVSGTYDDETPLPKKLSLFATRGPAEKEELVTDSKGNDQTGNLVVDEVYNENTFYSFDITNFLNSQILSNESSRGYLILRHQTSEVAKNVERAVFGNKLFYGGMNPLKNRVEVEIFYTVYDEK